MLKLVLPKGSLETATLALFDDADLAVRRASDVDYKATVDDPRIDTVRILRPQEIARYVAEGLFDIGITARDWIEATATERGALGEHLSARAPPRRASIGLAVAEGDPPRAGADVSAGVRAAPEPPELTRRFLEKNGVAADIRL